jgi:hypothetical protein
MNDSSDQYRAARVEKATRLRQLGVDPFGSQPFAVTHSIAAARATCPAYDSAASEQLKGDRVIVVCHII